jgi:hypothetical protein
MQDDMRGGREESLRRALAEFADETGLGVASDRVRRRLQSEVRARARRRLFVGLSTALAAAAAVAAVLFGITARRAPVTAPSPSQTVARAVHPLGGPIAPVIAPALAEAPMPSRRSPRELGVGTRATGSGEHSKAATGPRRQKSMKPNGNSQPDANGAWRKGEMVLSPWYYNTALPPATRSVLVRSEVDARTAMRFGVVSAGDTAPVEILFGEDGLPRAMRFVRHLSTQSN